MNYYTRSFQPIGYFFAATAWLVGGLGCAPQRPYRAPAPLSSSAPMARSPQTPAALPPAAPPATESVQNGLPPESIIREQDLRGKTPPPRAVSKESKEPVRRASVSEPLAPATPPLPDDSSLLGKITPNASPQRVASLRLTDEGRKLLDAGDPVKALSRLERTILVDSTNPYGYFYLAKAQYNLGRYQQSLNFIEVAESRLGAEPFWLAEIHALRGENFRGLNQPQKAEASYHQALRLNSGNRTAADGLVRLQQQSETPAASK